MGTADVRKNTIYNAVKSVCGIVYPLITFPYISRVLLAENIGKINFSGSVVSYFSLIASIGISTYAIREISQARFCLLIFVQPSWLMLPLALPCYLQDRWMRTEN